MSLVNMKNPSGMIEAIIYTVLAISILASMVGLILTGFTNLSTALASVPIVGNLFGSTGIMRTILGFAIVLGVLAMLGFSKKGKR